MLFEDEFHNRELELITALDQEIEARAVQIQSLHQEIDTLDQRRTVLQQARAEEERRFVRMLEL